MPKTTKIEFRCTVEFRQRILSLRPLLGVRSLSAAIRRLAEIAVNDPGGRSPWLSVPALMSVAQHLDRIAAALHRCLLTGASVENHLREVETTLAELREMLGRNSYSSGKDRTAATKISAWRTDHSALSSGTGSEA